MLKRDLRGSLKIDKGFLLGKTTEELVTYDDVLVHRDVKGPLLSLSEQAKREGFDLRIVSAHRSFEYQKLLWNAKAQGQRPICDSVGEPLDSSLLSPRELVLSILRWSALPGTSRHHWGSDIDVIDGNALPQDYTVKLIPEEVVPEGIFGPFHRWLDKKISEGESFGFYRPYARDLGGIAPEKWHLSYAPLSVELATSYNFDFFQRFLEGPEVSEILLVDIVQNAAEEIFTRFIAKTSPPPFLKLKI